MTENCHGIPEQCWFSRPVVVLIPGIPLSEIWGHLWAILSQGSSQWSPVWEKPVPHPPAAPLALAAPAVPPRPLREVLAEDLYDHAARAQRGALQGAYNNGVVLLRQGGALLPLAHS